MNKPDRKQREFERREKDVFDAALALFSQPKWESVTIEQIAKLAGVGKGTVYKHVSSKDELLFKLTLQFYRGLLQRFQLEDTNSNDVLQSFKHIFNIAFQYHLDHSEYRYIVEYTNRIDFKERADECWHDAFWELDSAFNQWGDPLLIEAMNAGVIAQRPLDHISIGMHACFDGTVNMLWSGKDWCSHGSKEDIIEAATEFMMAGLIGQ
jgi:AcrR family transcriptional regulator